ncbi:MAG: hypothetical protein WC455_18330, partial [Dehalococcoidia bacterium]
MRRALVLCITILLFPAVFVAGIMFADYGADDLTPAPTTAVPPSEVEVESGQSVIPEQWGE